MRFNTSVLKTNKTIMSRALESISPCKHQRFEIVFDKGVESICWQWLTEEKGFVKPPYSPRLNMDPWGKYRFTEVLLK